jgi:hypothetical protein
VGRGRPTELHIGLFVILVLIPLDGALGGGVHEILEIPVTGRAICFDGLRGGVVLPGLDRTLDALVVEVGVVLLLEALEDGFQLRDLRLGSVPLVLDRPQTVRQVIHLVFRQARQDAQLPALACTPHHLALLRPLHIR